MEGRTWAGTARRRAGVPWAVLGFDNRLVVPARLVPIVPKNLDPTQHEAREGRAGPARHGPSPSSSPHMLNN